MGSNFHRSCRWFQCRDLPAFTSREAMESHVKAAHSSMACNCGGVADYIGDGSVPDASRWRCAKCGSTFKTGPSRYSMGVLA